jgi:hypothetical protein
MEVIPMLDITAATRYVRRSDSFLALRSDTAIRASLASSSAASALPSDATRRTGTAERLGGRPRAEKESGAKASRAGGPRAREAARGNGAATSLATAMR